MMRHEYSPLRARLFEPHMECCPAAALRTLELDIARSCSRNTGLLHTYTPTAVRMLGVMLFANRIESNTRRALCIQYVLYVMQSEAKL